MTAQEWTKYTIAIPGIIGGRKNKVLKKVDKMHDNKFYTLQDVSSNLKTPYQALVRVLQEEQVLRKDLCFYAKYKAQGFYDASGTVIGTKFSYGPTLTKTGFEFLQTIYKRHTNCN